MRILPPQVKTTKTKSSRMTLSLSLTIRSPTTPDDEESDEDLLGDVVPDDDPDDELDELELESLELVVARESLR